MSILTEDQINQLKKASYKVIGNHKHSAVKLCHWTKESVKSAGKKICYKQKFYGIKSHRCIQMTPALPFCTMRCLYCWRDTSITYPEWEGPFDDPETIINESIKAQQSLITGLGGVDHGPEHLKEANDPNQVAISLAGEPTIYPKLSELIQKYKERNFSTFLVTNGTLPEKLKALDSIPSNLYISVSATDEEMHKKLENPIIKNSWKRINESLKWMSTVDTTTVIRLTMVKGWNMTSPEKYAEIVSQANPKYIEVKSFMPVGWSSKRLPFEAMPSHEEIQSFSEKVADSLGYKLKDEQKESRVVLLSK